MAMTDTSSVASSDTTGAWEVVSFVISSCVLGRLLWKHVGIIHDSKRETKSNNDETQPNESVSPVSTMTLPKETVRQWRKQYFSNRLSVSYANSDPLMIIKGRKSRLIDETGTSYLDTRNNVAHCGHCHPRVVEAVQEQVAMLNTNTRYLHPTMTILAQRLLSQLSPPLGNAGGGIGGGKVFFCNSGSEANDLALRLAKAYSGGSINTIVVQGAYHGHTLAVLDASPYKFMKGNEYQLQPQPTVSPQVNTTTGTSTISTDQNIQMQFKNESESGTFFKTPGSHIWQVPIPDIYRGKHRNPETAGLEYAQYVKTACDYYTKTKNENVRAFIVEGGFSIGGVVLPPKGYLFHCAHAVRQAGGLYIADEVQTGFGRFGSSFWAFEHDNNNKKNGNTHVVVPDIVTMGKPMGNGMPLAAVVCTKEVADAFDNCGVEYFNTFGGNPVSCAAGLAVLDVIKEERLQQHALEIGTYMKGQLENIAQQQQQQQQHIDLLPLIGQVRGNGLFLGVELILDYETLEPATLDTHVICSILRQKYHILTTIDGIYENVFVIKPPLVFSKADVDYFVSSFRHAMTVDLQEERSRHPEWWNKNANNTSATILTPT